MILSDRSIREELDAGRIVIDPLADDAVQPSSVDLRVDASFRVFANHRYPYIDVREPQPDLTDLIKVPDDEPFMLHPGEFVLGSTYERVTVPDDLVARLEGKALALDTEVPTPFGWTTMGELRPGDVVFAEVAEAEAGEVAFVGGVAEAAEVGVVRRFDAHRAAGREQAVELLHGAHDVGDVLDYVHGADLVEAFVAQRPREVIEIGHDVGARGRITIDADRAGILVYAAAGVENAHGSIVSPDGPRAGPSRPRSERR